MADRPTSSALPLAWLYAGLIAYASLYPFTWRWGGSPPLDFLLSWPRGVTRFDVVSNVLGYVPLGLLSFVAVLRGGARRPLVAAVAAVACGAVLSALMETAQNLVPVRVPSSLDLVTNVAGTAAGAAIGFVAHATGGIGYWQGFRQRWFVARSGGGIALLLFWPLALLFPAPLPLGLGSGLGELGLLLVDALEGSAAQDWAQEWLDRGLTHDALPRASELAAVACGLIAPCALAFSIAPLARRRLVLLGGALLLGVGATALSTALNFGPQHALAWLTPTANGGLLTGALMAAAMTLLPRRLCAGIGLVALTACIAIVAQAPDDPYYAQSLQGWEQGRFIRFHGAAQWVGWLWPYAAIAYLLAVLGARRTDS